MVVARGLYEHAVTLGWLTGDAADARQRFLAWQRYDDEQRGKVDRGMSKLMRRELLSDERRARAKAGEERRLGTAYLSRFEPQRVTGRGEDELWVPAEEPDEFNPYIVGKVGLLAEYR